MANKQKSISRNFLYNATLKVINIIFPLATFPYIARILTASGIGKINFALSIISYFILFSRLGIPIYGIRECSKHTNNEDELSKTVQEILIINFISLLISIIIFYLMIFYLELFNDYKDVLMILSINIITTNVGIDWFYKAIEEYKYITIRNIIVKLISLILIFLLIKDKNDYINYAYILVISVSLSYMYNFFYSKKYINLFKKYKNYNFKKHIKPIFILFFMSISISIYVTLDKVMLGYLINESAVGYYTTANKIISLILILITSITAVLLPRMSYYFENELRDQINYLIEKALNFILLLSIPSVVGIFLLSKPIILIFVGNGFVDSILTLKLLSPVILIISLGQLIGSQILISHEKERLTLISTIVGAIINFILNLIFIPMFSYNGAAISTVVAEIAVTSIQIYFAYFYLKANLKLKNLLQYVLGSLLIMIICITINNILVNDILIIILSISISTITYFGFLLYCENDFLIFIKNKILFKLKKLNDH